MTLATIDYRRRRRRQRSHRCRSRPFAAAAEKLAEGDFPEALLLSDGGVAALRLDEIVPPTPVPLDKVRDSVAEAWRADQLAAALAAQATAAEAAVKAGATLQSQGQVIQIPATTRGATPTGTTADAVQAAFAMTMGETRRSGNADFTGLIQLDSITPVDLAADAAKASREASGAAGRAKHRRRTPSRCSPPR